MLGGAPGARSKRWAGATGTPPQVDAANNAELLRRLQGAPVTKRGARYRCVLVFLKGPNAIPAVIEGQTAGRILEEAEGSAISNACPTLGLKAIVTRTADAATAASSPRPGAGPAGRSAQGLTLAPEPSTFTTYQVPSTKYQAPRTTYQVAVPGRSSAR